MKCPNCQQENRSKALFCSSCGKKIIADAPQVYEKHIKKVSIFFFTLLAYIAILHFTKLVTDFSSIVISDLLFILIVVIFFVINFSNLKPYLATRTLRPLTMIAVIACAVLFAFIVSGVADFLNKNLFDRTESAYYTHYLDSPSPLFFAILSIGVVPAIFEEIAFRGILFNEFQMVTSTPAVILITSILFTLLHFSLISAIWLFPGAIALGFLRSKYNTLNYGILAHFTYNTSIVLLQMYYHK
jgi:membrane protease YdiL (CAAX protease family)